jgi:tetratricopeptide (TPR) repeat protein
LILTELASAQMRAGQPARALDSLVEALRLDPRFSGAWMLLAELRLRNSSGEPRQVQEAARYYLVAFWFTRDRPALIKRYRAKLKPGPEDPPHTAAAIQIALQRLTP